MRTQRNVGRRRWRRRNTSTSLMFQTNILCQRIEPGGRIDSKTQFPDFVNLYSIVVALSHSGCLKTTKQHIEWSVFEQVHQEKYNIIFNNIGYDIRMILQIKMASLPFPPFGQVEYNGRMKHWCRHGVRRFLQLNELMLTRVFVGISVAREVMAGWLDDWMMDLLKSLSWCLKCRLLSFVPASSLSFIVLHYSPFTMYHQLTCDHTLNLVSTEHSMNG